MLFSHFSLALSLLIVTAWSRDTDTQAGRSLGTFMHPSQYVRPRFRYWVPDASVRLSDIADDLESVKRAGAGGMELLGYYYYGATQYSSEVVVPSDWTVYGWGTEAWKNLTLFTLQQCKAKDLALDFAIGPNQGSGVPAKPESEGLMMDLVPHNTSFSLNGVFSGQIPGWGAGRFVSASIALVVNSKPANLSATPGFLGPIYYNGTNYTLKASSLLDVTSEVTAEGRLDLRLPQTKMGLEYRLFAFYERFSGYRAQASPTELYQDGVPQSPITDYVQNGSWVPDHFSSKGAQVVIDFWERNLLDDQSRELFREVGNYGWEDSMEFGQGVAVWWTPTILQKFLTHKGYKFNKYLPLLYSFASSHPGPLPSPDVFYLDGDDKGISFLNYYYEMLTILNRDYLTALRNWLASSLNSKLSAQVAYNLPMEMAANIPAVDVPECESLGFYHNVDAYRQFSGPANLAGKRVISNELGAVQGAAYTQTLPELIWDVKLSIMGGVNEMIFHGYPFSGYYGNNSWPGYTTFFYRFSSMHGPRQPAWDYYDDYMNWTARMQFVSQSGIPRIDLALWTHDDVTYDVSTRYAPRDLEKHGFSYNYISPSNFGLEDAYVANNTLGPDQQAFKAFVVMHNDTMTIAGVKTLELWAHQGLPLVFAGGLPSRVSTHSELKNLPSIMVILEDLSSLPNVHIVPATNLAEHLISVVGLTPATLVRSTRPWLTHWREDGDSSITFVIIYNDATGLRPDEADSTGSVTFATSGVPYVYDAWTGGKTPVLGYNQTCDTITIPLALAGNQTTIIAFHHDESSNAHLHPGLTGLYTSTATEHTDGTQVTTCAADVGSPLKRTNQSRADNSSSTSAMIIGNWTLVVEVWTAPTTALEFEQNYTSIKQNTTFQLQGLAPWGQISDSLRNVSGRGFYNSTFHWPASGASDGAILNLGYITHTARVWINGKQVPPLDPTRPVADVTDMLLPGQNLIEVVVATTLGGSVRKAWEEIVTGATRAALAAVVPDEQDYGLLYPVELLSCRRTRTLVV